MRRAVSPSQEGGAVAPVVYYLVWRSHSNHPWHSEELFNRIEAHNKYFSLIQRGYEAYLQKRQPAALVA
jgi:hypothetical protein